ncbi:hypothetical protein DRN86_03815, partial [Candidatus Geothermarchaeota archaeon]
MGKSLVKSILLISIFTLILASPVLATCSSDDRRMSASQGLPIRPISLSEFKNVSSEMIEGIIDVDEDGLVRVLIGYEGEPKLPNYVKVDKKYRLIPYLSARVPADKIGELSRIPGIRISYDLKVGVEWMRTARGNRSLAVNQFYPYIGFYPTFLNESLDLIGVKDLWSLGLTGKGVVIAILDTGINKDHPSLDDLDDDPETFDPKVVDEVSFVPGESADDFNGHGTYVASIAAGTGYPGGRRFYSTFYGEYQNATITPKTQKGVAPDALLLNVKVLNKYGVGYESWVIAGIEWAVDHGADVISMSLGGPALYPSDPLTRAISEATKRGVIVVVAAGNDGPGYFSVSSPGISPEAITVGAIYELGGVTWFSGRGPTPVTLNVKPDVLAPGVAVLGANAFFEEDDTFYCSGWGTSPATVFVSGSVALLLQAFPGATPEAIKIALMKSAWDTNLDVNVQGAGIINVQEAYRLLKKSEKILNEFKPKILRSERKFRELNGVNISFVGDYVSFSSFIHELEDLGANVRILDSLSQNLTLPHVLIMARPSEEILKNASSVFNLLLNEGRGIFLIGDDGHLIDSYESLTGRFGIHWSPLGLAVGGLSTNICRHAITEGVEAMFLGGPLASLRVENDAQTIIYDPIYPALAIWDGKERGRLAVLSDDDVLNDYYLNYEDNFKLGVNLVKWLSGLSRTEIHEVSIGLSYPSYVYNSSESHLIIDLRNLGGFTEEISINLQILNEKGKVFLNWTSYSIIPAGGNLKEIIEIYLTSNRSYELFTVNASITIPDFDPNNNHVNVSMVVLSKNHRKGENPVIFAVYPFKLDSFTSPLVSTFPGDFKVLNFTFISSVNISNPVIAIE